MALNEPKFHKVSPCGSTDSPELKDKHAQLKQCKVAVGTDSILVWIRKHTSDEDLIGEVITNHCYENRGFDPASAEVWLDGGAQIGLFTCSMLMKGCTVYALEPDADNYRLLRANIKALPSEIGVCAYIAQAGLVSHKFRKKFGDEQGRVQLLNHPKESDTCRHTFMAETLEKSKPYQKKQPRVPGYTLKEILAQTSITGVKLDIEGMELEVVQEMRSWKQVQMLTMEYSFEHNDKGGDYKRVMNKLARHFIGGVDSNHRNENFIVGDRFKLLAHWPLYVYASVQPFAEKLVPQSARKSEQKVRKAALKRPAARGGQLNPDAPRGKAKAALCKGFGKLVSRLRRCKACAKKQLGAAHCRFILKHTAPAASDTSGAPRKQ